MASIYHVQDPGGQRHRRPRTAPMSCAECRRLKLKCNREFPCGNCVRKGCSAICPEGALTTGRGNRFILANTGVLHDKISQLANRVRSLENALKESHQLHTGSAHPLLTEDLLQIKRPLEREWSEPASKEVKPELGDEIEAIGLLSISNDGRGAFFGRTASAWLLLQNEEGFEEEDIQSLQSPTFTSQVHELGSSFPFANMPTTDVRESIFNSLPQLQDAQRMCNIYFRHAAWMYTPIPENDFYVTVFRPIYNDVEVVESHSLAILLMALAIGTLVDLDKPAESPEASFFYDLARAALNLDSVMEEHSVPGIQALLMMCHFLFLMDQSGTRWVLMGMVVKLAQSVGLHRDSISWNLESEEAQRRRMLFYELLTYDSWQSLTFGRPPSISSLHFDTKPPFPLSTGDVMSFAAWKHKFTSQCLNTVHDEAFGARTPNYKSLQELDLKVRQFEVPRNLQVPGFGTAKVNLHLEEPSVDLTMQRYTAHAIREMTLFYMHRGYFAQAMENNPVDPMGSKFGPSVLAAYTSACSYVGLIESLFQQHPTLTERMWFLFTHVFSCAIVLGTVAANTRMPLASSALASLETAHNIFWKVTARSRTEKILAILKMLLGKARAAHSGGQLLGPMDGNGVFGEVGRKTNELSSLNGKTRLVSRRSLHSSSYAPSPPQAETPNFIEQTRYAGSTSESVHQWQVQNQTTSQLYDGPSYSIQAVFDITSYGALNAPSGSMNDYTGFQTYYPTVPTSEASSSQNLSPFDSWNLLASRYNSPK